MPRSAWGHALFADDLRAEIGGKISLMGLYQIDMLFQTDFPITLPKLAILIQYFEERDAFKDDVTLTIRAPGKDDPLLSTTIARKDMAPAPYPYKDKVPEAERDLQLAFTMPVLLSPVVIPEEGFMTVKVQTGETITGLGRLMLRKARPEETSKFSGLVSSAP